mgnify:CR=1 FL=1
MRMRAFIAHDMAEALAMVRREMGPDAIIVSSERTAGGNLEIRAAIEDSEPDPVFPEPEPAPAAEAGEEDDPHGAELPPDTEDAEQPPRATGAALGWHGVPELLAGELADSAAALGEEEPIPGLALALETRFSFRPVQPDSGRRPVLLVGAPGAGKSSAAGKLAARAALAGKSARLICADAVRAGAKAQLEAYAEAAQADFVFAESRAQLRQFASAGESLVVIDAPACNPTDEDDLTELLALAQAASAEPVLVLDAGQRAEEAASVARAFARIGARRLILSKLDVVRRKGAALAAAESGGLAFAQMSFSPYLVGGFAPATPLRLARLLLEEAAPGRAPIALYETEAA